MHYPERPKKGDRITAAGQNKLVDAAASARVQGVQGLVASQSPSGVRIAAPHQLTMTLVTLTSEWTETGDYWLAEGVESYLHRGSGDPIEPRKPTRECIVASCSVPASVIGDTLPAWWDSTSGFWIVNGGGGGSDQIANWTEKNEAGTETAWQGGVFSTGAQSFRGPKTFRDNITIQGVNTTTSKYYACKIISSFADNPGYSPSSTTVTDQGFFYVASSETPSPSRFVGMACAVDLGPSGAFGDCYVDIGLNNRISGGGDPSTKNTTYSMTAWCGNFRLYAPSSDYGKPYFSIVESSFAEHKGLWEEVLIPLYGDDYVILKFSGGVLTKTTYDSF
jgi:hypothetical protein